MTPETISKPVCVMFYATTDTQTQGTSLTFHSHRKLYYYLAEGPATPPTRVEYNVIMLLLVIASNSPLSHLNYEKAAGQGKQR